MRLTPGKLQDVIMAALKGAKSAEADRLHESIAWLPPKELRKLSDAVNDAFEVGVGQDEEE